MNSLIFATFAVSPIIITVVIGYVIKKAGLMTYDMAKGLNKLVFRLFLPAMLFLNVYNIDDFALVDYGYILYAVVVILAVFLIAIPAVTLISPRAERRGVLLQASFRSNFALIGIPLAESLFGKQGVAVASILSAVSIPFFNILAVISLCSFGGKKKKPSVVKIISEIAHNPLIHSILLGILALGIRALLVKYHISFRLTDIKPVYAVLESLSSLATPLALIVLGVQFEFSAVKELKKEICFGVFLRTVAVPLIGLGVALVLFRERFGGAEFAALTALFATPVAVSSVPMAQEMSADHTLAGQLVVWSTLVSAMTVFLVSFWLKAAGVF